MFDLFAWELLAVTRNSKEEKKDIGEVIVDRSKQHQRFIEAARELGCDESGRTFDDALGRILPRRKPGEPAPCVMDEVKPKGSRRRKASPE